MRSPSRARRPQCHRNAALRAGFSTLYLIALVPVLGLVLVVITDYATIWLARIELQNALDAAALSAVETWCEGPNSSPRRLASRDDARLAFEANTVLGVPLDFPDAAFENGNGANPGNIECMHDCPGGIVLLGSIRNVEGDYTPDDPPPFVFNGDVPPDKINVRVFIQPGNLFTNTDAYQVDIFGATSLTISTVVITIPPDFGANGYFDARPSPNPTANPGPDMSFDTDDDVGSGPAVILGPPATFTPSVFVPPATGPSIAGATFRTITIDYGIGGLPAGTPSRFGLDADFLGNSGVGSNGSDFSSEPGPDALVSVTLSDGTVLSGTFAPFAGGSRFQRRIGVNECAAQVRACIEVPSICSQYLGIGLGPYDVSAKATAWYRCDAPNPREPELIRATEFVCTP